MGKNGVDYTPQKPMTGVRKFITECIEKARGEDLTRAQLEFRQYTPEQMKDEHDNSGKTRQQVLDELQYHNHKCDVAIRISEAFIPRWSIFGKPSEYGIGEKRQEKSLAENG